MVMFLKFFYNFWYYLVLFFSLCAFFFFFTPFKFIFKLLVGIFLDFFRFLNYVRLRFVDRELLFIFLTNCLFLVLFPFLFYFLVLFYFFYYLWKSLVAYLCLVIVDSVRVLNFFKFDSPLVDYFQSILELWSASEFNRGSCAYLLHFGVVGTSYFFLRLIWSYTSPFLVRVFEKFLYFLLHVVLVIIIRIILIIESVLNFFYHLWLDTRELRLLILVFVLYGPILFWLNIRELWYRYYELRHLDDPYNDLYNEWKRYTGVDIEAWIDIVYSIKFACVDFFIFIQRCLFYSYFFFILCLDFVFFNLFFFLKCFFSFFFFFVLSIGDFFFLFFSLELFWKRILFFFYVLWSFLLLVFSSPFILFVFYTSYINYNVYFLVVLSFLYLENLYKYYSVMLYDLARAFEYYFLKLIYYSFFVCSHMSILFRSNRFVVKYGFFNFIDLMSTIILYVFYYFFVVLYCYMVRKLLNFFLRFLNEHNPRVILAYLNLFVLLFQLFLIYLIRFLYIITYFVFYILNIFFLSLLLIVSFSRYLSFIVFYFYLFSCGISYLFEKWYIHFFLIYDSFLELLDEVESLDDI